MNLVTIGLSIGSVPTTRKQKEFQEELATNHRMDSGDITAGIRLFPPGTWAKVQNAQASLREYLYANSLPWGDNGERVVPMDQALVLRAELEKRVSEYRDIVSQSLVDYDSLVAARRVGSFATVSYPSKEKMETRLQATLSWGIPASDDSRLTMANESAQVIRDLARETYENRLKETCDSAFNRLYEVLDRMIERLEAHGNGGRFQDRMFDSARDMIAALRGLNVTNDEDLEFSLTELSRTLDAPEHKPEVLRESEELRKKAITRMKGIRALARDPLTAFAGGE